MTTATTLKLANNFNNIIAIKEASGNFDQIMELVEKKPSHFEKQGTMSKDTPSLGRIPFTFLLCPVMGVSWEM